MRNCIFVFFGLLLGCTLVLIAIPKKDSTDAPDPDPTQAPVVVYKPPVERKITDEVALISERSIGKIDFLVVEVEGQRFVVAKHGNCITMQPLDFTPP